MMNLWMAVFFLMFSAQTAQPQDSLTITLQGQTIAVVHRTDFTAPVPVAPMIDDQKYSQFINKIDQQIYRAPVNAMINEQGSIIHGQPGRRLYRQTFKDQFYAYFFGFGPSKIELPLLNIYPKVDGELLANIRVKKIGRYATYFNAGNTNRTHNILLAAKAIDNYVVFPNETFSFNEVVGKRTPDKGYTSAPIIVKGEFSEDIGGGICQVSSTLFNAVDNAGLYIVERYSHSRSVPYVPPGRDATVSWYGPDLRFQNKYNQPILIRAKQYGGSIEVTLYSSDVINIEPRKIPDPSSQLPEEIKKQPETQSSRPPGDEKSRYP